MRINGLPSWSRSNELYKVSLTLRRGKPIEVEVGFLELDLLPDGGLLGQDGFFDQFDIRFQRWRNAIHIVRRPSWVKG